MTKIKQIRDPIHNFVEFDNIEKKIIDSPPFQRLRHIHQLAMTYMVYPGATHKRFEHSLGVMELASQIFDRIMNKHNRYLGFFDCFVNCKFKDWWFL